MRTYKVEVSYQYESPYSGYSHNDSTVVTVQAASDEAAYRKARTAAQKQGGSASCMEYITGTKIISKPSIMDMKRKDILAMKKKRT